MPDYNFDISKVRNLEDPSKFLFNLGNHVVMDSPAPGAINVVTSPLLEWADTLSVFADRYKVEVSTNPEGTFEAGVFLTARTTNQSYQIVATLNAATTYYWRVTPLVFLSQQVNIVTNLVIDDSNFEIEENGSKQIFYTTESVGSPDESVTLSISDEVNFSITDNGGSATLLETGTAAVGSTVDVTITSVSNPLATDTKTYTVINASGAVTEQDSVTGDFEALQAFYTATLGNDPDIPTLASTNDLPAPETSTYPHLYLINGDIHYVKLDIGNTIVGWENAGTPWQDKTGWDTMTESTMGDAVGVEVDANGRVITLDVQKITSEVYSTGRITTGNSLIGKLVPELKNLKKLKRINLKQNFFFGSIPTGLTNSWPEIERISLGGQRSEIDLTNRFNSDGATHRKVYYNDDHFDTSTIGKEVASTNRFRTHLEDISDKPNLELFECRGQYTLGTLPEFTNCPALDGIFINQNRGSVSQGISGAIPTSWYSLNPIKIYLTNDTKRFSGTITDTPNWTNLAVFQIWKNDFKGKAPSFLNSTDKRAYSIGDNQFTDITILDFFNGDNARLNDFSVDNNPYSNVQLPATIQTVNDSLSSIRFRNCGFIGPIPEWVAEFPKVQIVDLALNEFTGGVPLALFTNKIIKTVYLSYNNLTDPLPDQNWDTARMEVFDISYNNIPGTIPASWASLFQNNYGDFTVTFAGTYIESELTIKSVDENGNEINGIYTARDPKNITVTSSGGNTTVTGKSDIGNELIVEESSTGTRLGATFPDTTGEWKTDVLVFSVRGNLLEGTIPDWGKYSPTTMLQYFFERNKFVFADILTHKTEIENAIGGKFTYGNQKRFGDSQTITKAVGESFIVDYSGKSHVDDVYQWKKESNDYADTDANLNIASVASSDAGFYSLEITNSNLPELGTLQSNETELEIA